MAVFLLVLSAAWDLRTAAAAERTQQVLAERWLVKQVEGDRPDPAALAAELGRPDAAWLPARMPAQVHDVLLAHGRIPDPRVSKNAAESAWVGAKDWVYACKFASPPRNDGPVFLRFLGLDTLAQAYLNGKPVGQFDNMHREYAVEVKDRLVPDGKENLLLIVFSSPLRHVSGIKVPERLKGISPFKYLRKCHSDFGSYLGATPHSVKVGVFRDVVLDMPGRAWIEDVWVRAKLRQDGNEASVRAQVETVGRSGTLAWVLADPAGNEVARGSQASTAGVTDLTIAVKEPQLWWPWTHGRPRRYQLEVALHEGQRELDRRTVRFGIRDVRPVLKDRQTGEPRFRFDVNGLPVFLRGACWAPLEGMTHSWNSERARRLLDLMEHGRMNVLRIWGEGHVPPQEFYDECDRRGIFVWQDFMFGYGMHPSQDKTFVENCRLEIEGMIRRLRSHPCILLWVGGNENHMGWDFAYGTKPSGGDELFGRIMPGAVARLDPDRLFHPSSPYGGPVPNWPLEGDWHDYTTLTFSPESSVPTYASEVGRASAPSLASMKRFLSDEELWPKGFSAAIREPGQPAWPPMWQYRSVGGSWDKVGPVEQFCDPQSAEELIRVLGTAHGEYLRDRVERERRGVPDGGADGNRRCWGNMVWRLNDSWPILYWSVIDYYLEPKIPFYFLRRSYAPVLVSFERTPDRIAVWVVNDSLEEVAGTLVVSRRRFNGPTRGELRAEVRLGPGESKRCLPLSPLGPISLREEFLHARFNDQEATCLLTGERNLHLPPARLTAAIGPGGEITLATDQFARQVTLEMQGASGAMFGDNFFDMPPGQKRSVAVIDAAGSRNLSIRAINAEPIRLRFQSSAEDASPTTREGRHDP